MPHSDRSQMKDRRRPVVPAIAAARQFPFHENPVIPAGFAQRLHIAPASLNQPYLWNLFLAWRAPRETSTRRPRGVGAHLAMPGVAVPFENPAARLRQQEDR